VSLAVTMVLTVVILHFSSDGRMNAFATIETGFDCCEKK
jgi:hypothetical protein